MWASTVNLFLFLLPIDKILQNCVTSLTRPKDNSPCGEQCGPGGRSPHVDGDEVGTTRSRNPTMGSGRAFYLLHYLQRSKILNQ